MVSGPFYFFHAVVCCQAFSQKSEQAEKINPFPSSTARPYLQVQGANSSGKEMKMTPTGQEVDVFWGPVEKRLESK